MKRIIHQDLHFTCLKFDNYLNYVKKLFDSVILKLLQNVFIFFTIFKLKWQVTSTTGKCDTSYIRLTFCVAN